jgi:hypothetical protein
MTICLMPRVLSSLLAGSVEQSTLRISAYYEVDTIAIHRLTRSSGSGDSQWLLLQRGSCMSTTVQAVVCWQPSDRAPAPVLCCSPAITVTARQLLANDV